MPEQVPFRTIAIAAPQIGEDDIAAVVEVLRSGMLAQGPRVAELERRFADYCGTEHAVAVANGTAALHAALVAAGVVPGDDVVVPPFTFVATANAVLMAGARPVFVDVREDDFGLDAERFASAVTPRTTTVVPVHLFGQTVDTAAICAVARRRGLVVVEDAAQAVGATDGGVRAGAFGAVASFSLYATKNLMCGEGGLVTTDDAAIAQRLRTFRQHGMVGPYDYAELGYNYRMTDLQAAVAVTQLSKLDASTARRVANARVLDDGLAGLPGVRTPSVMPGRTHVYHQYTLAIEAGCPVTRDQLLAGLRERGVGANIYYPKPLNAYPHLAGMTPFPTPVADRLAAQVLSLPVHQGLSDPDLAHLVASVREIVGG